MGTRMGDHHDSCKILDDEYKTEWEESFIFAVYCREDEERLEDMLDPPSWLPPTNGRVEIKIDFRWRS